MKKNSLYLASLLVLLALVGITGSYRAHRVSAQVSETPASLSGWAWSDNIGWISLSCTDGSPTGGSICDTSVYGVNDDGSGNLNGYAWSDSIGWIKFGGLSGFPSGGSAQANATRDPATGVLSGWVQAISGANRTDGWDGWISLSGVASDGSNTPYGLTYDSLSGGYSGYAWGSDVVGWLTFNASNPVTPPPSCDPAEDQVCESATLIPSVSLFVSPTTISINSSPTTSTAALSWQTQNVTTCSGSGDGWTGDIGTATSSGTQNVGPFSSIVGSPHLYVLTCQSPYGPVSSSVSLSVTGVAVPVINPPASCPSVQNASYCAGSQGSASTIVTSCTSPANTNSCEFICDAGFSRIGKNCVLNSTVTEH